VYSTGAYDRHYQKNYFLIFAKCLKMFFAFAFKGFKKCYYDPPPPFFCQKIKIGVKNAEFYADFEFVDAGFKKGS
jgi:hypothetical protein